MHNQSILAAVTTKEMLLGKKKLEAKKILYVCKNFTKCMCKVKHAITDCNDTYKYIY